jgi:hypothetical protein
VIEALISVNVLCPITIHNGFHYCRYDVEPLKQAMHPTELPNDMSKNQGKELGVFITQHSMAYTQISLEVQQVFSL